MEKYALISVFDKEGIVEAAKAVSDLGYKIISTGGTAKVLVKKNIPVVPIEKITGNPESFDGRMKTISFQIEGGILFDRSNPSHLNQAKELNIKPIDVVICNLYPFEQTAAKPQVKQAEIIENIDVGGPAMIRAAAKNFKNVIVIVDPKDYTTVIESIRSQSISGRIRKQLAAKAFSHLSFYDSQIANYLNDELFPEKITIPGRKLINLRYGENPHQEGSMYLKPNSNSPFENLKKLWGRDLSFLNVTDINAGLESVSLFIKPCAVVIKHNTPCGIALGESLEQALKRAIEADPESAFGGVIVLNKPMNLKCAQVITSFKNEIKANIDIVAIPEIHQDALGLLQKTRKSMGVYSYGHPEFISGSRLVSLEMLKQVKHDKYNIKFIDGGFLLQTPDNEIEQSFKEWKIATKAKPSKKQLEQMQIAWKFISRIKSNAIIIVDKDLPMTRGIGTGQTSRVRSTKIALGQAGKYAKGAILASDSFFPFDDSVKLAKQYGISAIVQQGGSINDRLSIEAADKAGISMVFTNRRAFWH